MKKLKLFSLLLIVIISANAQITKGNWMMGGTGNFNSYKYIYVVDTQRINHLTITPNIGYFFANKIAIGSYVSYGFDDYKGNNAIKYSHYAIGPFFRYYFLKPENKINFLAQVNYGYEEGKANNNRGGKYHNNGYGIKAGSAIFFNSSVALELTIDYNSTKINSTSDVHLFQVGLGFQIHLEKEK